MSVSSSHDDVVELVLHLRGLRISISGPAREATQLASDIAQLPAHRAREPSTESSYTLLTAPSEAPPQIPASRPARETRSSIEASFDLCPRELLSQGRRLSAAGSLSGPDRVSRADCRSVGKSSSCRESR